MAGPWITKTPPWNWVSRTVDYLIVIPNIYVLPSSQFVSGETTAPQGGSVLKSTQVPSLSLRHREYSP
jgi:hypothetical protein